MNLATLSKQDVFLNEVIAINQFVKDEIEMFRQSLPQNISISLANDVLQLHASIDATQFERVMLNLLINAREALEIFAAHRDSIALVILDLVMPVMSGQHAAVEIRKISPAVKVLFISGYLSELKGSTMQLNGPLLRKPFRSAALQEKVAEIFRQM